MSGPTFRDRLVSKLTDLDRRNSKRPGHNPYALGHYLNAADGVVDARTFAAAFTPTRSMHRIARELELDLDVERGRWVTKYERRPL